LLMQSMALQTESLALLGWLRARLPGALLGVSGLSWGGTMAACAGAFFDGPIAITTIVASPNFDPLLDGVLDKEIAWSTLAFPEPAGTGDCTGTGTGTGTSTAPHPSTHPPARDGGVEGRAAAIERARERMRALFDRFSFERILEIFAAHASNTHFRRARTAPKAALHAGAAHDGFVKLRHSEALHARLMQLGTHSRHITVPGGHVSSFVFAPLFAHMIARSLSKLERHLERVAARAPSLAHTSARHVNARHEGDPPAASEAVGAALPSASATHRVTNLPRMPHSRL